MTGGGYPGAGVGVALGDADDVGTVELEGVGSGSGSVSVGLGLVKKVWYKLSPLVMPSKGTSTRAKLV